MVILRPGFFTLDPAVGMPARKGKGGGRKNIPQTANSGIFGEAGERGDGGMRSKR